MLLSLGLLHITAVQNDQYLLLNACIIGRGGTTAYCRTAVGPGREFVRALMKHGKPDNHIHGLLSSIHFCCC